MNIIKYFIAFSIFFSPFTFADPLLKINLRFKAMILDHTCIVAPENSSIDVELGTWGTKNMINIGDQTRPIPFSIRLLDCTAKKVSLSFKGSQDTTNPKLLALSQNSTAQHIAIQIFDNEHRLLPIDTFTTPLMIKDKKDLQLDFFANYIAIGKNVTAGTANSTAIFLLNYD